MRVPISWLREFVPVELSAEELGDLLSRKGAHLESIERPWSGLDGVRVAQVLEVLDHPNSEKLCLARVQAGSGEIEVVVGVRNMVAGDLVPLAAPGARLPALAEPMSAREIRGVISGGMLCSPWELGLSQDHGGILVLNGEGLEAGQDLKAGLGLDEEVLELEIETNRPDLLSVVGIAREVAAATGLPMSDPDPFVEEDEEPAYEAATVEVADPGGCPHYLARVIRGVSIGPSPLRVQARLSAVGMRPLANAIDATNYVMLEMGQPLHAFDLQRLSGPGILVRKAREGERLTTLDDVQRELLPTDLLICDLERPLAIAGVMGGASSEVSVDTKDVLLESATFEPRGVLRTSRRLILPTEAAIRFSRGTDPEGVGPSAARAAALIASWGGGVVLRGAIDVGSVPPRRRVTVRPARASLIAGEALGSAEIVEALERIQVRASQGPDGVLEADIPGFRPDLEREVDLIEEVIRVRGYDLVGATLPGIRQAGGLAAGIVFRRRIRDRLVRAGLREALSLSFASKADLDLFGHENAVRVANPPSADEPFLRTSLVPNLVRAIARNVGRGGQGATLFEVGHVFRAGEPVDEREFVAGVLAGSAERGLHAERRGFDVLDAKGAMAALLDGLGARGWSLGDALGAPFHPARSAAVVLGGAGVGVLGELHPSTLERFGLEGRVAVFELDASLLPTSADRALRFRDVPRFPPIRRDLAFIVSEETPAGMVQGAIEDAAGELLGRCELFDVFRGGSLAVGTKSLAFAVEFRAPDRTLVDEEAEEVVGRIVARLAEDFGAELRAG